MKTANLSNFWILALKYVSGETLGSSVHFAGQYEFIFKVRADEADESGFKSRLVVFLEQFGAEIRTLLKKK